MIGMRKMKNSQIKKLSRKIIRGNVKSSSVFIFLFVGGLILFSVVPFAVNYYLEGSVFSLPTLAVILLLNGAAYGAFFAASRAWFLFFKQKKRSVKTFYWFRPAKAVKSTGLYFSLFFKKLMWTLIFTSPGLLLITAAVLVAADGGVEFNLFATWIAGGAVLLLTGAAFLYIFLQRYFLVPYLKIINPTVKNREIFSKSREYMSGSIKKAALMKLSFLPWFSLSAAVIPVFYVWTYYSQSCAVMAQDICRQQKERELSHLAQTE